MQKLGLASQEWHPVLQRDDAGVEEGVLGERIGPANDESGGWCGGQDERSGVIHQYNTTIRVQD